MAFVASKNSYSYWMGNAYKIERLEAIRERNKFRTRIKGEDHKEIKGLLKDTTCHFLVDGQIDIEIHDLQFAIDTLRRG